ncbi:GGDEF domain-containing protein [Petrocella sp. FN5]|uniref:GGDEF domain-containing protein n=1 Tax=Petrocella sp. FN5 TaxID=3032002 RepID=UPI0023DC2EA9|nr:GGDEF domain-containing protein [Petrocella sp. FN5]MDF1617449.1 GGDEF domain-containing protein [Petrocella sp. FN5]
MKWLNEYFICLMDKDEKKAFDLEVLKLNIHRTRILSALIILLEGLFLLISFVPVLPINYGDYLLIYRSFYIFLLVYAGIYLFCITHTKIRKKLTYSFMENWLVISGFLLLMWSMGITLIDQMRDVHNFTYFFMLMAFASATVISPNKSFFIYFGNHALYLILHPVVGLSGDQLVSNIFNASTVVITSWIISVIFYKYHHRDFVKQQKIIEQQKALERLSSRDPLTNLYNRRNLDHKLLEHYQKAVEAKTPLTVLMVDIDYYKGYNDSYGHVKGDKIIQIVAQYIKTIVREHGGYACRYGGDEICMIFSQLSEDQLEEVRERLHEALRSEAIENKASRVSEYVTISIGAYAKVPKKHMDPMEFIAKADEDLYDEKESRIQIKV